VAKQKFGLGRGLDALLTGASEVRGSQQTTRVDENAILFAEIDSIIPNPRQPRRVFRDDDPKLKELSDSIKEHGLLQPLVVARLAHHTGNDQRLKGTADDPWPGPGADANDRAASARSSAHSVQFQLVVGERRWRASRMAGLTKVPVVIKEVTPLQMLELALIENIQRADLNPIEEALAYQALIQEFGLTQEMVARAVGKDRSTITNSIRLLQLAPKVREALINAQEYFSEGHARALIGITREEDQIHANDKIIALRLNVRQAEELASRIKAAERANGTSHVPPARPRAGRSAELEDLETAFRNSLMLKVDLKCNTKGEGTLVLHFSNRDELERLYSQLTQGKE
jgi:ParB family chromosome partitioning protein